MLLPFLAIVITAPSIELLISRLVLLEDIFTPLTLFGLFEPLRLVEAGDS